MNLLKVITPEEIQELEKQETELSMFEFDSFLGIDGELYYDQGRTLGPEHFKVVGVNVIAVPESAKNEPIRRAVEMTRIKESNAYMLNYELTVKSHFGLLEHKRGKTSQNDYVILSVAYFRVNEEKLKECREKD